MSKYLHMCCNEAEMREAAAKICRDFLHGAWKTVAPQDLIFKRISGGLSNFLYYVALPSTPHSSPLSLSPVCPVAPHSAHGGTPGQVLGAPAKGGHSYTLSGLLQQPEIASRAPFSLQEPRKVLVRIYGQTQSERGVDNIIMDSVIFTLLSERRLGPKLHGVFSGGRIEEFIPARQLETREMSEPALSMKIAEKMAAIHSMDVPLCKEPQWLWKKMAKWTSKVLQHLHDHHSEDKNELALVAKLRAYNLEKEVAWLKDYLSTVDSPVVFCHNDLQEGNILLREDVLIADDDTNDDLNVDYSSISQELASNTISEPAARHSSKENNHTHHRHAPQPSRDMNQPTMEEDNNTNDSISSQASEGDGEPRLVLIDYEYCSYNHRGFDLANHFIEWAYDYTNPDPPFFYEKFDQYPSIEQKAMFIRQYLRAMCGGEGREVVGEEEQVNRLHSEVEAYTLASHLFWALWAVANAAHSKIPFGYWEYAVSRMTWYCRLKQEIIKKDSSGGTSLKRKIREVDI